LDELAAAEHERWAHWQQYIHDQGERSADGSLIIPAEFVERWTEQINAEFSSLSEEEKESDREQVRRYLPLIIAALAQPPA
jgi:hypothetical protein